MEGAGVTMSSEWVTKLLQVVDKGQRCWDECRCVKTTGGTWGYRLKHTLSQRPERDEGRSKNNATGKCSKETFSAHLFSPCHREEKTRSLGEEAIVDQSSH